MGDGRSIQKKALIMDDESMIREVTSALLNALGYKAYATENGVQTLEIVKDNYFEVIIIDANIKTKPNSLETLAALKKTNPNTKIIVTSGAFNCKIFKNARAYGFSNKIAKPFSMEQLKHCLNEH